MGFLVNSLVTITSASSEIKCINLIIHIWSFVFSMVYVTTIALEKQMGSPIMKGIQSRIGKDLFFLGKDRQKGKC